MKNEMQRSRFGFVKRRHLITTSSIAVAFVAALSWGLLAAPSPATADEIGGESPVKILLITSGCCHDYDFQTKALQLAMDRHGVEAVWTVAAEGGTSKDAKFSIFDDPKWAEGYDLVIHNECFADVTDADYIRRITDAHRGGVDAIVIHCALHTYRDAEIDDWRKFLGVSSNHHEHQSRYPVKVVAPEHPIMQGVPDDYTSAMDELYVIKKVWPGTEVLARSPSEKDGQTYPVFWTGRYGQATIFGTSYGHSNETFQDEVFLGVIARAAKWILQQ